MDKDKWSYLAGVVEGEGCIGVYAEARRAPRGCLDVVQAGERGHAWLQYLCKRYNVGKVYRHERAHGNSRTSYRWQIRRQDELKEVLTAIQPYLLLKMTQAIVMLDWLNGDLDGHAAIQTLKRLKGRSNAECV